MYIERYIDFIILRWKKGTLVLRGPSMSKSIRIASVIAATAAFFVLQATGNARAATYTLTLTDSSAPTFSGTGTLIVSGTPGTGQYCLSGTCTPGDVLTSLTFTVDGFSFSSADAGASGVSATFTAGVLTALGFNETVNGNDQLHMPAGGNLEYSFQEYNGPEYYTTGTVTDVFAATTPLPAALPLFAGGLGAFGLFGWRRKRKAQAAA
jgi:hypothetical protein